MVYRFKGYRFKSDITHLEFELLNINFFLFLLQTIFLGAAEFTKYSQKALVYVDKAIKENLLQLLNFMAICYAL